MITVVVADDHPVVREGLAALLLSVDDMTVVAQAATGSEAVRVALQYRPDVVVMDIHMPGTDGVEAARQITASGPQTRILVLTMFEDDATVVAALRAGASGYLLKGATQAEILGAIRAVASGNALFSAAVMKQIVARLDEPPPDSGGRGLEGLVGLTPREKEILDLLAAGRSNQAIARRLGISAKTVANHLSAVFPKLNVNDRTQAVILARRAGLGNA
jgi:DNA-binding NarL/FixJ family response regulator